MLGSDTCVFLCAPHGGPSRVMVEVNKSYVCGCSVSFGVLSSMYPIPVSWVLSKKWSSLIKFFSVLSTG